MKKQFKICAKFLELYSCWFCMALKKLYLALKNLKRFKVFFPTNLMNYYNIYTINVLWSPTFKTLPCHKNEKLNQSM